MKIGDKVVINDDTLINIAGEIERVSVSDHWPYLIKYGNGYSAWFSEDELTLVTE